MGAVPTDFLRLWEGSTRVLKSAPKWVLIQSCALRQLLVKRAVKPFPGKDWETGVSACSLCIEPRGIASSYAHAPINNCFFVCHIPMELHECKKKFKKWMTWGHVSLVAAKKVGVLAVWSKLFIQREARTWGFSFNCMVLCLVGFMVKVCLSLSYSFFQSSDV